jgi:membrane-associated protease RseP (regulator of RpoE activity)
MASRAIIIDSDERGINPRCDLGQTPGFKAGATEVQRVERCRRTRCWPDPRSIFQTCVFPRTSFNAALMNPCPFLVVATVALFTTGCIAEKFQTFYTVYSVNPESAGAKYLPYSGKTEVLRVDNMTVETQQLFRRGYIKLGESTRGRGGEKGLMNTAEQVGADIVLVKNPDTTPSPQGQPTPWEASFWRKGTPPVFGARSTQLSEDLRAELKRDHGVRVTTVVDDSPAAKAGLRPGDILVGIGDNRAFTQENVGRIFAQHAGQRLDIRFLRGGEEKTVSAQLNPLPKGETQAPRPRP